VPQSSFIIIIVVVVVVVVVVVGCLHIMLYERQRIATASSSTVETKTSYFASSFIWFTVTPELESERPFWVT
jgi:flagellar basal body-associated protein FliL